MKRALAGVTVITSLSLCHAARADDALPKSGLFEKGLSLEVPAIGPMFMFTPFGSRTGLSVAGALQFDLGPRWALRVPLDVGTTLGDETGRGFATIGFAPGVLHRWRSSPDQALVPYAGLALRLAAIGIGRGLVNLPLVDTTTAPLTKSLRPRDLDDDGDSADDPNTESALRVSPELWAGVEWHPNTWLSLNFAATYFYARMFGVGIHVITPRVGLRFSF